MECRMSEQLNSRVEACFVQAEAYFRRTFPRPSVCTGLRGYKAGVAYLQENRLRFNSQLYRDNPEDFLRQTVAHEVAHLVAHQLFGRRIRPHGREWQQIMRVVFDLPPLRCHNYAVQRRPALRYLYRCQCADGEFPFSQRRHNLVHAGRQYLCRRCRTLLLFSGESRHD
jgi:SprT protein